MRWSSQATPRDCIIGALMVGLFLGGLAWAAATAAGM
jgi:hypothetical protein